MRDVTADAAYHTSNPKIASVNADAVVRAEAAGDAAVVVTYQRKAAVLRVGHPAARTEPFPKLAANNRIDELVYRKLKAMGVPPSDLATDEAFLRRVYLDVIGILPTAEEARRLPAKPRSRRTDRQPPGARRVQRFLVPQVGRPVAHQERVPGTRLAQGGRGLLPMGPRQPCRQQALRPVRARTADRDRQQLPRRSGELRARRAEQGRAYAGRDHGAGLYGRTHRLRPLPCASAGKLDVRRRSGPRRVFRPRELQGHPGMEGRDRLYRLPRQLAAPAYALDCRAAISRRRRPREGGRRRRSARATGGVAHRAATIPTSPGRS